MRCKGSLLPDVPSHPPTEMQAVDTHEVDRRFRCPECGVIVEEDNE